MTSSQQCTKCFSCQGPLNMVLKPLQDRSAITKLLSEERYMQKLSFKMSI